MINSNLNHMTSQLKKSKHRNQMLQHVTPAVGLIDCKWLDLSCKANGGSFARNGYFSDVNAFTQTCDVDV